MVVLVRLITAPRCALDYLSLKLESCHGVRAAIHARVLPVSNADPPNPNPSCQCADARGYMQGYTSRLDSKLSKTTMAKAVSMCTAWGPPAHSGQCRCWRAHDQADGLRMQSYDFFGQKPSTLPYTLVTNDAAPPSTALEAS